MQTYEPSRKATSSQPPVSAYAFLAPRPFAEPPQPEAVPLSTASGGVGISLARINCVPQELRPVLQLKLTIGELRDPYEQEDCIPQERSPVLQPKLTIGKLGDPYEQEADRVAADVVQKMNAPVTSLTPPASGVEDEKPLQRLFPLHAKQRVAASSQAPVEQTEAEIQCNEEFHENGRQRIGQTGVTEAKRTVMRAPAAGNYHETDEAFVSDVRIGTVEVEGEVTWQLERDSQNRPKILFAIPFNQYDCQIHIHWYPHIKEGERYFAHIYSNDRRIKSQIIVQDAVEEVLNMCVRQEDMKVALVAAENATYGHTTVKNIVGRRIDQLGRGDYK